MTSEDAGLVPTQRLDHGLNSSLVFHDQSHRFNCGASQRRAGDPDLKTRELGGFIDGRYFKPHVEEFRPSMYAEAGRDRRDHENWNGNGRASSGDDSEGDDDDEDDDEEDEDDEVDGEVEGLGGAAKIDNGKAKHLSSFVGSSREAMMKDVSIVQSGNENNNARASPSEDHRHGRLSQYQNAVSVADPEGNLYFSRYLQGPGGSSIGQKDTLFENGSGFSGRKDSLFSNEHGVSLRAILSDPLTGALMDDAVILPCGHSFGAGGIQHVIRMKACYTCSQAVSEDSVAPNLSLQAAIQAFRREEELHVYRASKRRRERFEQEKGTYGDLTLEDHPRSRGVQFPFAVTDRVIIKGNKRTPPRFVGREAVVTTQCLNGWYVVKTLDNAESVKLQYRSLAKVSDDSSAKPMSDKMTPNWL